MCWSTCAGSDTDTPLATHINFCLTCNLSQVVGPLSIPIGLMNEKKHIHTYIHTYIYI